MNDPYLYKVYVEVNDGSSVTDLIDEPLGIRYFSLDPNSGFYLNGKYLNFHGACRHQDRLDKGWAISFDDTSEDFTIMKERGCNALRLAHYQQNQNMYDLCDKNGIVVWAEIPVVNSIRDSQAFTDNAKNMLKELIRQNYNHPSIIFWSIFNEITLVLGPDPNNLIDTLNSLASSEDSQQELLQPVHMQATLML